MLKTLLTTSEVAKLLQCTEAYIRKPEMILALQGLRIGNKYRFEVKNVEFFIQQQKDATQIQCEEILQAKNSPNKTLLKKKRASKHNLW